MAISILDVRDTFGPVRLRLPAVRPRTATAATAPATATTATPIAATTTRRRPPLPVLTAGLGRILQGVALLAVGLTALDGLLAGPRPATGAAVLAAVLLAGWIVASAGGGAALIDGTGRRTLVALSCAELVLLAGFLGVTATTSWGVPAPAGLPLPAVALAALAVPAGTLLLAGTPSAVAWVAQGPRIRERRPDPVAAHRVLCTLTLAVIGLGLGALAVLTPVTADSHASVTSEVTSEVTSVVSGR